MRLPLFLARRTFGWVAAQESRHCLGPVVHARNDVVFGPCQPNKVLCRPKPTLVAPTGRDNGRGLSFAKERCQHVAHDPNRPQYGPQLTRQASPAHRWADESPFTRAAPASPWRIPPWWDGNLLATVNHRLGPRASADPCWCSPAADQWSDRESARWPGSRQ